MAGKPGKIDAGRPRGHVLSPPRPSPPPTHTHVHTIPVEDQRKSTTKSRFFSLPTLVEYQEAYPIHGNDVYRRWVSYCLLTYVVYNQSGFVVCRRHSSSAILKSTVWYFSAYKSWCRHFSSYEVWQPSYYYTCTSDTQAHMPNI